jgi:Lrp/AsnC family transcriptional regulator for asnA, asnC and gidA
VSVTCTPQTVRIAAASLARRSDTTFIYTLTGHVDCVTEIRTSAGLLPTLLFDELPGTPGVVGMSTLPVMKYYRTGFEWHPDFLTAQQIAELRDFVPPPQSPNDTTKTLNSTDRAILRLLAGDGRLPNDKLARAAGISEPTARRRVDDLRRSGAIAMRAVIDPAHVGLPVEAILWIKAAPGDIDAIGEALLTHPGVRYAAAMTGEYQVVADLIVANKEELHTVITQSPMPNRAHAVVTTFVVTALKRSGVLSPSLRSTTDDV